MADGNQLDPVVALIIAARTNFAAFVSAVHRPRFIHSHFSLTVCKAVDQFVEDVIAGKRPVLVLTAGPQHGKSSLISRCLPPYLVGRLGAGMGTARIALTSYALSRAKANGRDAKSIMMEPIYREIFPEAALADFKGGQNTADYFDHPHGFIKSQGAGGSLTGFSIDCFAPDTLVSTDAGPIRIDQLHIHAKTVKVLCHDGTHLRYARIKAVAHRQATRLYRITTDAGRVLEVTGNHPIYSAGTYRPASELAAGDVLLCAVPKVDDKDRGGLREVRSSVGVGRSVLQQELQPCDGKDLSDMPGLREADRCVRTRPLQALPSSTPRRDYRGDTQESRDAVRTLWRHVRVSLESWIPVILQQGLRRWCARRSDARGSQSQLARRQGEVDLPDATARAPHVSLCAPGDLGTGSPHVSGVRRNGPARSAPYQRESAGQHVVQFADLVPSVPPGLSPRADDFRAQSDTVRSVEILDGPVRVFDIQVETHACLFAAGILAHNCGIIDDAVKDAQEALSSTVQDGLESWFDAVFSTRLQQRSGQVIMGTPWSANDLLARVHEKFKDKPNYKRLQFVSLNLPGEIGYNPDQPEGPLVPALHDETKLREIKSTMAESWWAAMFQSAPMSELGAIFSPQHVRYYRRSDTPLHFVQVVMSVDATFKDSKGSDYVFAGVWGKTQDERVWLLDFRRERLSFSRTAEAIVGLKQAFPRITKIFIEDAANGPALIDMLSKHVPGIVGVPPLGSKEARAHAVSWVWQNGMVMLPHPDDNPSVKALVAEITAFPDVRNDDGVDGMTIALQQLCLRNPISAMITNDILKMAGRR